MLQNFLFYKIIIQIPERPLYYHQPPVSNVQQRPGVHKAYSVMPMRPVIPQYNIGARSPHQQNTYNEYYGVRSAPKKTTFAYYTGNTYGDSATNYHNQSSAYSRY